MTIPPDSPRLRDALARHQVYLEGLKSTYSQDFVNVTELLRRDLRDAFLDIEFDDLSFMTRRQLELFIRRLQLIQSAHYSIYTKKLLDDLREFMDADNEMMVDILRDTQDDNAAKLALLAALLLAKKQDRLWITISNAPVPASGATMEDMIKRFATTGAYNIETAVRRAWANKSTVVGALNSIVGTSRLRYRDGIMSRSIPQADALTATILQHVSSIVQANAVSIYYPEYVWVSIMDGKTSDICISLDGKIFRYGEGPLPPAHWKCRSHTEPYMQGRTDDESFAEWKKRQPQAVQDDMSGPPKPLTLKEFIGKLGLILAD